MTHVEHPARTRPAVVRHNRVARAVEHDAVLQDLLEARRWAPVHRERDAQARPPAERRPPWEVLDALHVRAVPAAQNLRRRRGWDRKVEEPGGKGAYVEALSLGGSVLIDGGMYGHATYLFPELCPCSTMVLRDLRLYRVVRLLVICHLFRSKYRDREQQEETGGECNAARVLGGAIL